MIQPASAQFEASAGTPAWASDDVWPGQNRLSGVAFLRSLTAMILTAGWGCKVTTGQLFVLAQDSALDSEQQATVRSALWLTLVSHPRSVLEFAAADAAGQSRLILKLAVQENHPTSGLTLEFLEKLAENGQSPSIQAVALELLAHKRISERHFQMVSSAA